MKWIYQQRICNECETRIRFGDIECPHCGLDLEESIDEWIIPLANQISSLENIVNVYPMNRLIGKINTFSFKLGQRIKKLVGKLKNYTVTL